MTYHNTAIRVLHPFRPLLFTEKGFQIEVSDLSTGGSAAQTQFDKKGILLDMPFNGKVVWIESIQVSRSGQFLFVIARTNENSFDDSKYHIVIYDIATFQVRCHSIIPGLS